MRSLVAPGQNLVWFYSGWPWATTEALPVRPHWGRLPSLHQTWYTANAFQSLKWVNFSLCSWVKLRIWAPGQPCSYTYLHSQPSHLIWSLFIRGLCQRTSSGASAFLWQRSEGNSKTPFYTLISTFQPWPFLLASSFKVRKTECMSLFVQGSLGNKMTLPCVLIHLTWTTCHSMGKYGQGGVWELGILRFSFLLILLL